MFLCVCHHPGSSFFDLQTEICVCVCVYKFQFEYEFVPEKREVAVHIFYQGWSLRNICARGFAL